MERSLVLHSGPVPKHLRYDEVRRLIDCCEEIPEWQRFKVARRNRLLLEVLWQAGCRIGEVLGGPKVKDGKVKGHYHGLRPCDLDPRYGLIYIDVEKRRQPFSHHVRLEPGLVAELVAYYHEAQRGWEEAIFKVSKRQVQAMIKKAGRQAGLQRDITPHILRHSHGIYLREQNVHAFVMQEAMGHASLASTLVYGKATEEDTARIKSQIAWS